MNRILLRLTVCAALLSVSICPMNAQGSQDPSPPDCLLSRKDNKLFCNEKPYREVMFLRQPKDGRIIGISVYDFATEKEQWIYPSQGWKLAGNCCIELANNDAISIRKISADWQGTVSASYPLAGGCYDVHFAEDNLHLLFTTQTLMTRNPVWEYSFLSGKIRKIGGTSKKHE